MHFINVVKLHFIEPDMLQNNQICIRKCTGRIRVVVQLGQWHR
jgi:hypothetical protein